MEGKKFKVRIEDTKSGEVQEGETDCAFLIYSNGVKDGEGVSVRAIQSIGGHYSELLALIQALDMLKESTQKNFFELIAGSSKTTEGEE